MFNVFESKKFGKLEDFRVKIFASDKRTTGNTRFVYLPFAVSNFSPEIPHILLVILKLRMFIRSYKI